HDAVVASSAQHRIANKGGEMTKGNSGWSQPMLGRRQAGGLLATAGLALAGLGRAQAAALKTGTLRVAVLADIVNYDPMQFSSQNATVMRNLYDTLIDYDEHGK